MNETSRERGDYQYLRRRLLTHYERAHEGLPPMLDEEGNSPWEEMRQLAQEESPDTAWELVKALVGEAPDYALTYIAAGPLEDLISFHPKDFIDRIESETRVNDRLRRALELVIIDAWVPEEVARRLRAIAPKIRLAPPLGPCG